MQFIPFIQNVVKETSQAIAQLQSYTQLTGEQKKERLDNFILDYFDNNFDKQVKMNFIFKPIVKKQARKAIPQLTQMVFDLVATQIEGIKNKLLK